MPNTLWNPSTANGARQKIKVKKILFFSERDHFVVF